MIGEIDPAFPKLYRQWKAFDLGYRSGPGSKRPWFYAGLKAEDEPKVWNFIEENYLSHYDDFLAVRFDWFSSGLWTLPFPGSTGDRWNFSDLDNVEISDRSERLLKKVKISERAQHLLREWHDPLDGSDEVKHFDWEASDARGLVAAKEVRRSLPESVYLEYRPFQEIVPTDGEPQELEVPDRILEFGQGSAQRP